MAHCRLSAASACFFERLAHRLVADRLDDAKLGHLVGQQPQAPLRAALQHFGAGQLDEPRLLLAVEFRLVLSVGGLPLNGASCAAL